MKRRNEHVTQPMPRETLAECAAYWRAILVGKGLVK